MKAIIFFSTLLLSASIFAQTPTEQIKRLQNDPNIVWVGEIYCDYEDLDNGYEGYNIDRYISDTLLDGNILHKFKQRTSIIKLQRNTAATNSWVHYFWYEIINPKTNAFADSDLNISLSEAAKNACFITIDTIDSTITNELSPDLIYGYRVRQLVFYNIKENIYYNLPLSLAPLKFEKDNNEKTIGLKPLFWLPIISQQTVINPNNTPNMPFIKSIEMNMPFVDMKILKETTTTTDIVTIWRDDIIKNHYNILAFPSGSNAAEPLSAEDIYEKFVYRILESPDPFISINTDTIIFIDLNLVALRFNQSFGWDDKQKSLTISTYSIAPIARNYDFNNIFLFEAPIFYLYPHRRYKTTK